MVEKITKWFYLTPFLKTKEKLHLLEISRELKQNHATVRQYLNNFEKQGILRKEYKGRLTLYYLNKDYPRLQEVIMMSELENTLKFLTQNLKINELMDHYSKQGKITIIFGSSVENFTKANDIDILTTSNNQKEEDIQKKLNLKLHVLNISSLKDVNETLRYEIQKKHIIISGFVDAIKWLHLNGA